MSSFILPVAVERADPRGERFSMLPELRERGVASRAGNQNNHSPGFPPPHVFQRRRLTIRHYWLTAGASKSAAVGDGPRDSGRLSTISISVNRGRTTSRPRRVSMKMPEAQVETIRDPPAVEASVAVETIASISNCAP